MKTITTKMKIYISSFILWLNFVNVVGTYYLLHVPKPPEVTERNDVDKRVWAYINPLRDLDGTQNRGLKLEIVVPPNINSIKHKQAGELVDSHQLIPLPDNDMKRPTIDLKNKIVNMDDLNNAIKNLEIKHRSDWKENKARIEAEYSIQNPGQNKELDDYDVLSNEGLALG